MKRLILNLLAVLFIAVAVPGFVSCNDDNGTPTPEPPKQSLSVVQKEWAFSGEADQYTIAIFANVAWKIEKTGDWMTLNATSGTGNGVFTVSVKENSTGGKLEGTITVKAVDTDTLIQSIKISQDTRENVLNITSQDSVTVPAAGQTVVIDVEANTDYAFEMSEWVAVIAAPASAKIVAYAMTKSKITLAIAPNESQKARVSNVVIKAGDQVKKTVKITQEGMAVIPDELTVSLTDGKSADSVQVSALGAALKLLVKTNVKYDVALDNWMDWAPLPAAVSAAESRTMTLNLAPNLNMPRKAILRFTWKEGEVQKNKEVLLFQRAIEFKINQVDSIPSAGGTCGFTISASAPGVHADSIKKMIFADLKPRYQDMKVLNVVGGRIEFGKQYQMERNGANYSKNPEFLEIMGNFYTEGRKEDITKSLYVVQKGSPAIYLTLLGDEAKIDTIHVDAAGSADVALGVVLHLINPVADDYTVAFDMNNVNAAVKSKTGTELHLTCAANKNYSPLVMYIDVASAKNTDNKCRVFIKQAAKPRPIGAITGLNENYDVLSAATTFDTENFFDRGKGYVCKATIQEAGGMELAITNQTVKDGIFNVEYSMEANTDAVARTATVKIELFDKEDGDLLDSKTFTVTQKGKVAAEKVVVTLEGGNRTLAKDGEGAPVRITITGGETYKFYFEFSGNVFPANWLVVRDVAGIYNLWHTGSGPGGEMTLYVTPGTEYNAADKDNYGTITLTK